jgi:plasmid stabilization system protein ParE
MEFRPEVHDDVAKAARWYEARETGLGEEFVEEIIHLWDSVAESPLIGSRRHPVMDVRWRYPRRFPYRVIYSIDDIGNSILVIAVLHAARHESKWQRRV